MFRTANNQYGSVRLSIHTDDKKGHISVEVYAHDNVEHSITTYTYYPERPDFYELACKKFDEVKARLEAYEVTA